MNGVQHPINIEEEIKMWRHIPNLRKLGFLGEGFLE